MGKKQGAAGAKRRLDGAAGAAADERLDSGDIASFDGLLEHRRRGGGPAGESARQRGRRRG